MTSDPITLTHLRIAARYKSKKEVKTKDGDTMTVYEYSDRQVANRHKEKAERIKKLHGKIGDLMTKVKRDMKSSDPEKKLTALAVALIHETYERVGNDESAKDGHYGVTGWNKSHVSFGKGKATLRYTGKSGVDHKKEVSDKTVLSALRDAYEAVEGEEADLFSWDSGKGSAGKITAEKVNAYLEDFGITAKDLRGYHANDEMRTRLAEERKKGGKLPTDPKERKAQLKEEFKKALEATAEAVGHTPSMCRSSYLIPGLEEAYVKDGTIQKA